jgi:hypothetical protein
LIVAQRQSKTTNQEKMLASLSRAAYLLREWFGGKMAKTRLRGMSIDELLKLRHDVDNVLARRSKELRDQLTRLGGETSRAKGGRGGALRGRKVPVKFRDRSGNTWAGRGAMPVWLRAKIKAGAKLQDFAVDKKAAPRKGRKQRRGRRAKR